MFSIILKQGRITLYCVFVKFVIQLIKQATDLVKSLNGRILKRDTVYVQYQML